MLSHKNQHAKLLALQGTFFYRVLDLKTLVLLATGLYLAITWSDFVGSPNHFAELRRKHNRKTEWMAVRLIYI